MPSAIGGVMFPFLTLFGLSVPMYGICILAGLTAGILLAVFRSKKAGLQRDDVFYSCLFAAIGLFVGGKVLYLITLVPVFASKPDLLSSMEVWASILRGGFVFYGGLIGALLMIFWYTKLFKINTLQMLDGLIPAVPLAHAFGRIGCFLAGCCYGVPCEWGLTFNASETAPHNVKLLPVQLIESGCNFTLMVLLLAVGRRCKRRGVLTGLYLSGYAVMRFVLEFFRYDAERGSVLRLSTSQWISLLLLPAGILLMIFGERAKHPDESQ